MSAPIAQDVPSAPATVHDALHKWSVGEAAMEMKSAVQWALRSL